MFWVLVAAVVMLVFIVLPMALRYFFPRWSDKWGI